MKKRPLITVFSIAVLLFTLSAARSFSAVLLDRVVATVNDEVITWSELVNVITIEGRTFLEGISDDERKTRMKEMERPFLNNLIEMKLQLQEALRKGLNVSEAELTGAIAEIKEKYGMTDEVFNNSLKAEGLTMEDYRMRFSDQILLRKVVNFEVKSNIVITDREVEEYYNSHKEAFTGKEKVNIRQIFFLKPDSDADRAAVEDKARNIFLRVSAGEDFAKMASEFSEDPSRQFGGDLGYISRGSVIREVEDAAFALKTGEVSEPFWSPAGLHIIKLEDRIEGGSLEQVRDKVEDIIYQKTFEAKYNEWRTGLRENSYIEIKLQ